VIFTQHVFPAVELQLAKIPKEIVEHPGRIG
jgi:hypothetical protein